MRRATADPHRRARCRTRATGKAHQAEATEFRDAVHSGHRANAVAH